jgi:hypothetical protein
MDQPTSLPRNSAASPWHLWAVGIVGLLWNGFGAYDYLMSHLQPDAYPRSMGMTDAQIGYLVALPTWMTAAWAIGVWGAVLGTLLLLARRRLAYHLFLISLVALVLTLVYQYGLSNGAELAGPQGMMMSALILAGAMLFLVYARSMRARGVLR